MISHEILLGLMVVLLFSGILIGVPVFMVLIGVPMGIALIGAATESFDLAFIDAFPTRVFGMVTNPVFVSVPLFVLMGGMLEKSDIARRMMLTAGALFGERRGGMAYAVIIVAALLAASTGVIGATIFMLGMIALPAMISGHYSKKLSAGVICSAGSLGQIIPPSILLILLADQISSAYQAGRRAAGDWAADPVSVGDLFAGAMIPGLLLVSLYLLYVFILSIVKPEHCPPIRAGEIEGLNEVTSWKDVMHSLVFPLALILLVLGSILGGIATPTESAALGAAGALIMVAMSRPGLAAWRRSMYLGGMLAAVVLLMIKATGIPVSLESTDWLSVAGMIALGIFCIGIVLAVIQESMQGDLLEVSRNTIIMVSMLILIVFGAAMLSLVFRGLSGEEMITEFLSGLPGGTATALITVMVVVFLLGFIIEYVEIIFIVVPIAAPPLFAAGVDPVWFAILISLNLQMSFLTPPFGYALFYLRNVASDTLSTGEIYASIVPFIIIQLIALGLVVLIPELATWLPGVLYG